MELRRESRVASKALSVRDGVTGEIGNTIVGHPIVYNQETIINDYWYGKYREVMRPGACALSIATENIRMLGFHDSSQPLGTTKNGTLRLVEGPEGVECECTPANTQAGRDMVELIRRRDVEGMSFGFYVVRERWTFSDVEGELDLREVLEIKLIEVSPVTFPAYEQTDVALRAFSEGQQKDMQKLCSLVTRSKYGQLSGEQRATAKELLKSFEAILREEPEAKPADTEALAREAAEKEKVQCVLLDIELQLLELDAVS